MMPRSRRLATAPLALVALVSLAVACSSSPGERSATSSAPLTAGASCVGDPFEAQCTLEYVTIQGGSSSGGGSGVKPTMRHVELPGQIRVLECVCAEPVTGDPQGASGRLLGDTCAEEIDVPPALAGLGCTEGQRINSEPVWACPAGSAIPPVLESGATPCQVENGDPQTPDAGSCEAIYVLPYDPDPTRYFSTSCLGPAIQGWELVWERTLNHLIVNGSCDGLCLKAGSGDGGGDLPPVGDAQTQ